MKKPILLYFSSIILIISICFIGGCSNKTIPACTEYLPTTVSVGSTVLFVGCGSANGTYSWKFGDGGTATGDSVTHVYTSTGTYAASITEHSGNNTSGTKNFTVTVVNNNWSFKGMTYVADSVTANSTGSTMTAYSHSNNEMTSLVFAYNTLPVSGGSYTVVNAANGVATSGNVFVNMYIDSASFRNIYGSTGGSNTNVQVTVSGGKISMALSAAQLVNSTNASDSSAVSASLTQTQ
jgi:hypothetical protein